MSLVASASEQLWAEHGLTGLVICALIGIILLFIRTNTKKDDKHQSFLKTLLDEERQERKETRNENSKNSSKLAEALKGLTDEMRKPRE